MKSFELSSKNLQGMGRSGGWRSNSMDVLPYVDTEQDSSSTSYPQHAAPAALYPPALAQLSKLSQLEQLDILGNRNVSLAAVSDLLARLPTLRMLDVSFCHQLGESNIAQVISHYPGVSIKWSFTDSV